MPFSLDILADRDIQLLLLPLNNVVSTPFAIGP